MKNKLIKKLLSTIFYFLSFNFYLYSEIRVNASNDTISFSITSSSDIVSMQSYEGETIFFGPLVIKNTGNEPFDVSLFLTSTSPWKIVENFSSGKEQVMFYGLFTATTPVKDDFDSYDTIISTRKVTYINIFAKEDENKIVKGYDIISSEERKLYFRVDVPRQTNHKNQPQRFFLNITAMSTLQNTKIIDVEGGILEIPNRVELKILPGALKEPKEFLIRKFNSQLAGSPVVVYEILPRGTIFRRPCLLLFYYRELDISQIEDNLGIFYWDGYEWRYTGGTIDKTNKVVTANIIHLSIYALMEVNKTISYRPLEKIITPALTDDKNDYANFDGLSGKDVEINIFDITGRKVKTINVLSQGNIWDGKDDVGNIVESGVYIYQFKLEDKLYSGTIVVAK